MISAGLVTNYFIMINLNMCTIMWLTSELDPHEKEVAHP